MRTHDEDSLPWGSLKSPYREYEDMCAHKYIYIYTHAEGCIVVRVQGTYFPKPAWKRKKGPCKDQCPVKRGDISVLVCVGQVTLAVPTWSSSSNILCKPQNPKL